MNIWTNIDLLTRKMAGFRLSGKYVGHKPTRNKFTTPHQGKREVARRHRQIASGQLKKENGLEAS